MPGFSMEGKNKTLIHFYGRVIMKDQMKIEDVPPEVRDDVRGYIKSLKEEAEAQKESGES